ncbi:hypothetical protein ACNKHN_08495 [Shigella flexneri]
MPHYEHFDFHNLNFWGRAETLLPSLSDHAIDGREAVSVAAKLTNIDAALPNRNHNFDCEVEMQLVEYNYGLAQSLMTN